MFVLDLGHLRACPLTSSRCNTSFQMNTFGWHYLSNATCLIWHHLLYACFLMSRITIVCHIIRHFWRTPALRQIVLDECLPLKRTWYNHTIWSRAYAHAHTHTHAHASMQARTSAQHLLTHSSKFASSARWRGILRAAPRRRLTFQCFIGWSNNHFNNLHFILHLKQTQSLHVQLNKLWGFVFSLKRRLLTW